METLKEKCVCGAKLEISSGSWASVEHAHKRFLKAHEICRINKQSNFCQCGQIKHVGFDKCADCLDSIL